MHAYIHPTKCNDDHLPAVRKVGFFKLKKVKLIAIKIMKLVVTQHSV